MVYLTYLVSPKFISALTPPNTGRIAWNFEQTAAGSGYFLSMLKMNNQENRILGFQAHGKNVSADPISDISGFVRSDLTNAKIPIYFQAQEAEESKVLACIPHPWIPTLPDETLGIPAFADFEITTYDKPTIEIGKDGISKLGVPVSNFLTTFVPFTVVLQYDGMTVTRHFSRPEVERQFEIFERSLNPLSNPHILRKENAKPPVFPQLQTLLPSPQASPVPSLEHPQTKPISQNPDSAPTGKIEPKD